MTTDNGRATGQPADGEDGHDARAAEDALVPVAASLDDDPGAIRARLTGASSFGGETPVRVSQGPAAGVSTQRHPVVDGALRDVELLPAGGDRYVLREGAHRTSVVLASATATADGIAREVVVDGFRFQVETLSDRRATLRERATRVGTASAASGPLEVRAVIPGKVVAVAVAVGDPVKAGQQLLVVEAMKMQNELRSPRDGTITRVGVGQGVNIEVGDLLVVIS